MYGANRAICGGTREGAGAVRKGSKSVRDPHKLASELEQLRELNSEELRERWQTLFGAEPPPKLRSSPIVQGIAHRLQEKARGGLKPATNESPTMPPHADRFPSLRKRFAQAMGLCWSGSGTAPSIR